MIFIDLSMFKMSILIIWLLCVYVKCDLQITRIKKDATLVTVKLGDTVHLPCEIENRKEATVIWQYSKRRIPETLTIGYLQYRQDYRLRIITNLTVEHDQSWNLEIRRVKLEDEGSYVCRVMAEPEALKRTIYLKVEVDMNLTPLDPIVKIRESIVLFCNTSYVITNLNENLKLQINWYKDNETNQLQTYYINNISHNYRVEQITQPTIGSKLKIFHLSHSNYGTYYCKFRNQNVTTVLRRPGTPNFRKFDLFSSSSSSSASTSVSMQHNLLKNFIYFLFHLFYYYHSV